MSEPNHVSGTWLKRRWERLGYSAAGLARSAKISRATLQRIAAGGPVTADTASKLAEPLRLPAEAADALVRPDVSCEELDRLAGLLKLVVLWLALDLASVVFAAAWR